MRKFYIQAGNGLRYDLQNKNKCFFNNPEGLGFSKDNSYTSVGNYFEIDDSKNEQKQINGSLIFVGDWYANYNEFIRFIKSYTDYKLVYIYDSNEYYIDIDVVEVSKGDTKGQKYLECNINMESTSLWYKETSVNIDATVNSSPWDWNFDLTFSDDPIDKIDINNNGQTETPFEFELAGIVEDITLNVYKGGEIYNTITFDVTLSSGESLIYGNKDNELYVYKKSGETLTNVFDSLDLENDNWMKLPIGESSLKFESEVGTIASIKVKYYEEYEAV